MQIQPLTPLAAALAVLVGASAGVSAQGLPSPAASVSLEPEATAPAVPPPRLWFEPRVFISGTHSDNFLLSETNRQSEWIIRGGAGLQSVLNLPRLKGSIDYSLSGVYYARGLGDDGREQTLDTQLLLDAWDSTAFVEFEGAIGDERISAFGVQPIDSLNPANQAETRRFRVSPFLRGTWDNAYDYELRYTQTSARTDTDARSDLDERGWSALLASNESLGRLGWELAASSNEVEYSLGRQSRLDSISALLRYAVSPTLQVFGQAGRESNDLLTTQRESYSATTVGFDWRPVELARVSVARSNRYFGRGHNVTAEYRVRRVLLRYADSRDVFTSQLGLGDDVGGLSGFLDSLYQGLETDPVRRAQLVQAELTRLGLPADLTVIPGYLTSSASVQRNQSLSATVLGQRGVLVLSFNRNTARQLDPALSLGDDFDLSDDIVQTGWTASYAHRLSPRLSLSAVYQRLNTEGVSTSLTSRQHAISLGLTARLAQRTTGSLQVRHATFDGSSSYRETALQAALVHRF